MPSVFFFVFVFNGNKKTEKIIFERDIPSVETRRGIN